MASVLIIALSYNNELKYANEKLNILKDYYTELLPKENLNYQLFCLTDMIDRPRLFATKGNIMSHINMITKNNNDIIIHIIGKTNKTGTALLPQDYDVSGELELNYLFNKISNAKTENIITILDITGRYIPFFEYTYLTLNTERNHKRVITKNVLLTKNNVMSIEACNEKEHLFTKHFIEAIKRDYSNNISLINNICRQKDGSLPITNYLFYLSTPYKLDINKESQYFSIIKNIIEKKDKLEEEKKILEQIEKEKKDVYEKEMKNIGDFVVDDDGNYLTEKIINYQEQKNISNYDIVTKKKLIERQQKTLEEIKENVRKTDSTSSLVATSKLSFITVPNSDSKIEKPLKNKTVNKIQTDVNNKMDTNAQIEIEKERTKLSARRAGFGSPLI